MSETPDLHSREHLAEAFRLYGEALYGFVKARVGIREIAEDITQDVFLKAWQARDQFHAERGSLKTWLYSIALNAIRDYLRRQKHRSTVALPEDVIDEDEGGQSMSREDDLHRAILARVEKLSSHDRELLTLRFTQELSLEEIAQVMKMSYTATKVACHRAMHKLKELCRDLDELR